MRIFPLETAPPPWKSRVNKSFLAIAVFALFLILCTAPSVAYTADDPSTFPNDVGDESGILIIGDDVGPVGATGKLQGPTVTSPASGVKHKAGNPLLVKWTHNGIVIPDNYEVQLFHEGVLLGSWFESSKSFTIPADKLIQTGRYSVDVYSKKIGYSDDVWGSVEFSVVSSFEITKPTAGQEVSPTSSFTVTWTKDSSAKKYLISLNDTSIGNLLYFHKDVGTSTSFKIPAGTLTSGHSYRVAVGVCKNDIEVWEEREFVAAKIVEELQRPTITSPSSNINHPTGNPLLVKWTYSGTVTPDKYAVELYRGDDFIDSWETTSKSYTIPAENFILPGEYFVDVCSKKTGYKKSVYYEVSFDVVRSFEITKPTAGQEVSPSESFTVKWSADNSAEKYLLSLNDTSTGNLVYNRMNVGKVTSFKIPANTLTAGHPYRVAVGVCKNGVEVWEEREFVAENAGEDGSLQSPTITTPAWDIKHPTGNPLLIQWTYNGNVIPDGYKVELYREGAPLGAWQTASTGYEIPADKFIQLGRYSVDVYPKKAGYPEDEVWGNVQFDVVKSFEITSPTEMQVVSHDAAFTVTWSADNSAERYLLSLNDTSTENLVYNHMNLGTATSFVIPANTLTSGHSYRVAVGVCKNNAEVWDERNFIAGSNANGIAFAEYLLDFNGQKNTSLGYGTGWCAYFIGDMAKKFNSEYASIIPGSGSPFGLMKGVLNKGGTVVCFPYPKGDNVNYHPKFPEDKIQSILTVNDNKVPDMLTDRSTFRPEVGDIIGVIWDDQINNIDTVNNPISHVEVVTAVNGDRIKSISGNLIINSKSIVGMHEFNWTSGRKVGGMDGTIVAYARPAYSSISSQTPAPSVVANLQSPTVTIPSWNVEHPTGNPLYVQWTYSGSVTPDGYDVQLFREGEWQGSWFTSSKSYTIPADNFILPGRYSVDVYPKKAGYPEHKVWGNVQFDVVKSIDITSPAEWQSVSHDSALTVTWSADTSADRYLLSLRDTTTNTSLYNRMDIGRVTSFVIPVNTLTEGHKYRVAVCVCKNNVEVWDERNFNTGGNLNGAPFVEYLLKFEGKTGKELKYDDDWCAYFIGDRAKEFGHGSIIPKHGNTKGLIKLIFNAGGTVVCFPYPSSGFPKNKIQSDLTVNDEKIPLMITDRSSFRPEVGDIIGVLWDKHKNSKSVSHVEVVTAIDGNKITTISGNSGQGDSFLLRSVKTREFNWMTGRDTENSGTIVAYARPAYPQIYTPTPTPTSVPTTTPTSKPSVVPTSVPTATQTSKPTVVPTSTPTATPTPKPTVVPTSVPTATPTPKPTVVPTSVPTATPTPKPTVVPTSVPTATPTPKPTAVPTPTPKQTHTNHNGWISVNSLSEITGDGNYYLTKDVTLEETWVVPSGKKINLCLNGHVIQQTGSDMSVIKVSGSKTQLEICDCSDKKHYFDKNSNGLWTLNDAKTGSPQSVTGGVIIGGNTASANGGGVFINSGKFTLSGGNIVGNTAGNGGGGVYNGGDFTLSGGNIIGNIASGSGGGVCSDDVFTMYDGKISGNIANYGGGVFLNTGSLFTMYNGNISDNTAKNNGGGLSNNGGSFTMENGSISGNVAKNGGGVMSGGSFTMECGSISGNTASDSAGGVYVNSGTTFTMNGGDITGNKANDYYGDGGGGVVVGSGTAFTMNGGEITGNSVRRYGGGVSNYGTFTMNGGSISGNRASDDYGGGVYSRSTFKMIGGNIVDNYVSYSGGGVYVSSGTFTMENSSITNNTANSGGGVYVSAGTFTMENSSITKNIANYGGGMYVSEGTINMNSCNITGNTAIYSGGGVYSGQYYDVPTFIMSGGNIAGNIAGDNGGGVFVYQGTFTMNDGNISDNEANNGGGVYGNERSGATYTITVRSGNITGNIAEYNGGGVYASSSCKLALSGGNIAGNSAANYGGGVYSVNTVTMSGGNITDNTAENYGGNVYNLGAFTMSMGSITDNTGENNENVYNGGTFTMSGDVNVDEISLAYYDNKQGIIRIIGTEFTGGASYITKKGMQIGDTIVEIDKSSTILASDIAGQFLLANGLMMLTASEDNKKLIVAENPHPTPVPTRTPVPTPIPTSTPTPTPTPTPASPKFSGATLSLSTDIAVRFNVDDATLVGYSNPYIDVTFNGAEYKNIRAVHDAAAEKQRFTFRNISPAEMNDVIIAKLYATKDGSSSPVLCATCEYSVKQYCDNMLNKESTHSLLKTLCVDLLNYGSASQAYTGETDSAKFANYTLTPTQKSMASSVINPAVRNDQSISETGDDSVGVWRSASLNLYSDISLILKFTSYVDISNIEAEIKFGDGLTETATVSRFTDSTYSGGDCKQIKFNNMNAQELNYPVEITLVDKSTGKRSKTLTYSVDAYSYSKIDDGGDLGALVTSIMKYIRSVDRIA